jgi:hypothetical protein
MNFIKKIADKTFDNSVHLQFQKFSKGSFKNRAVLKVKKSKDKFTINASAEFANELVCSVAMELGSEKTAISGALVSTNDLKGEIDFKEIKQFQGVKRYLIDKEMSGNEILDLLKKFPKTFFALSFKSSQSELKIKPKAPKSGKPGTKGEEVPKPDFCKLITTNAKLGEEFVIETKDFKDATIYHEFVIEKIEVPNSLKDSEDFAKIREESKRVGKIIRTADIDGIKKNSELMFNA